ncbi:MAG: hypothetical protein ACKOX6_17060 [Bdellovibrio sp.]
MVNNQNTPNRETNASQGKKDFSKFEKQGSQRESSRDEKRSPERKENTFKDPKWADDKGKKGTENVNPSRTSGSSMKEGKGRESGMDDMDSEQRSLYRTDEERH